MCLRVFTAAANTPGNAVVAAEAAIGPLPAAVAGWRMREMRAWCNRNQGRPPRERWLAQTARLFQRSVLETPTRSLVARSSLSRLVDGDEDVVMLIAHSLPHASSICQ